MTDHVVRQITSGSQLIPIFFVPMPCAGNARIPLAEFQRIIRVTLQTEPVGVIKIDTCKNLIHDTECQDLIVERKIFCRIGLGQAILAYVFYIHLFSPSSHQAKNPLPLIPEGRFPSIGPQRSSRHDGRCPQQPHTRQAGPLPTYPR